MTCGVSPRKSNSASGKQYTYLRVWSGQHCSTPVSELGSRPKSVGRLVPLNVARQRFEADFRFSLVRFRENAESIALYSGEPVELRVFKERFRSVFDNFRHIMKRQRRLTCFTLGYTQVAVIFPLLVASPRYFAKQIGWGGLMQMVNAFSFVQNSLSFIVEACTATD